MNPVAVIEYYLRSPSSPLLNRAGTTRDAVKIEWEYRGRRIHLVDTAGESMSKIYHDAFHLMCVSFRYFTTREVGHKCDD